MSGSCNTCMHQVIRHGSPSDKNGLSSRNYSLCNNEDVCVHLPKEKHSGLVHIEMPYNFKCNYHVDKDYDTKGIPHYVSFI